MRLLGYLPRIVCLLTIPRHPVPRLLHGPATLAGRSQSNRRHTGRAPISSASSLGEGGDDSSPPPADDSCLQGGPAGRVPNAIKPGTVYVVATPMGNLGDITLRALDVLSGVDIIASEDTRHTGLLLHSLGVGKKRLVSHHMHNVGGSVPELVRLARDEKKAIALVTDAGTPGISDPGAELAAACWEAGVPLVPVPGPCAAVSALSVCGFLSSEFTFYAFLPRSGSARTAKLAEITTAQREKICVFYESPQRIARTLADLVAADAATAHRPVLLARELTKLHETLTRSTVGEALARLQEVDRPPKGEFTVVLGPAPRLEVTPEDRETQVREQLRLVMAEGVPMSEAVKRVAKAMKPEGLTKSIVYDIALSMKDEAQAESGGKPGEGAKQRRKKNKQPTDDAPE